jgi:hypothetical protein
MRSRCVRGRPCPWRRHLPATEFRMARVLSKRSAAFVRVIISSAIQGNRIFACWGLVGHTEVIETRLHGLVMGSRLVGSDLRTWHRFWADDGQTGSNRAEALANKAATRTGRGIQGHLADGGRAGVKPGFAASDAAVLFDYTTAPWNSRRESNPDLFVRTEAS